MNTSVGDKILIASMRRLLTVSGVTVSAGGLEYDALVSEEQAIDPDAPLGSDVREFTQISILREDNPGIAAQATVTIGDDALKVVRRIDNKADVFVKYWAVKP